MQPEPAQQQTTRDLEHLARELSKRWADTGEFDDALKAIRALWELIERLKAGEL